MREDAIGRACRTGSCTNLDWMADGLVQNDDERLDQGRDNDKKDDLQLAWGYGDIDPVWPEDEPAGEVVRHLPGEEDEVIHFARRMMNRGKMGRELVGSLRDNFTAEALSGAQDGLRQILSNEGILGCVAVDATGYRSCSAALADGRRSPFAKHIRYVIGCDCGQHEIPSAGSGLIGQRDVRVTGNATDDFFATDRHRATFQSVCNTTLRPVLAGQQDLPDEYMDDLLIDLMTTVPLSEEQAEKVRSEPTNRDKAKSAFRMARKAVDRDRRGRRVDAPVRPEKLDASEVQVDLDDPCGEQIEVVPQGDVSLPVEMAKRRRAEVRQRVDGVRQGAGTIPVDDGGNLGPLDFGGIDVATMEPEFADARVAIDLEPDGARIDGTGTFEMAEEVQVRGSMDVDPTGDFAVGVDRGHPGEQEIDPSTYQEDEFKGCDILALDDLCGVEELDVDPQGEMTW